MTGRPELRQQLSPIYELHQALQQQAFQNLLYENAKFGMGGWVEINKSDVIYFVT